jgi:hypothetical protein
MELKTQIEHLQLIATELRKDSRIQGVYLEYPAYLSVVISEQPESMVIFGFSQNSDEQTEGKLMAWNDFEQGRAMWANGQISFGDFATAPTAKENAQTLIAQLVEAEYLNA